MTVQVEKLLLELQPGSDSALVKVYKGDAVETFRASSTSLANIFVNKYDTGYLPVSGDGIVRLEERDGQKLIVAQRGPKEGHNLEWYDYDGDIDDYTVYTPYLYGFFMLEPSGNGYRIAKERIYCSDSGVLGDATPIFSTGWMGNVYGGPSGSHSNICWGSSHVVQGGQVTIMSLPGLLNDFLSQPFNHDLGGSPERWLDFSEERNLRRFAGNSWTMGEQIRRMWANEYC